MTDYRITVEQHPAPDGAQAVVQGLIRYNETRADPARWQPLTLLVRDAREDLLGGLVGSTQWEWLFVSHLWLEDAVRGRGLGRELILRAEKEAVARGCRHAHLDTFGFQAPGFYEKLGYEVFGRLDDYPTGHSRYFLRKHHLERPSHELP